jgi:hypothetical protein
MKTNVTNCFPCWTEDQRSTPATWAESLSPDAELLCDSHFRKLGMNTANCETIEAWRVAQGQPAHTPEEEQRRERQAAAGRKNGKNESTTELCQCGKAANHIGRHRGSAGNATPKKTVAHSRANGGSTEPSNSGRATRPTSHPTPQNGSKRYQKVAGFELQIVSLDEYRSSMPARISQDVLDPIVNFVKEMKAEQVALVPPPKGTTLKKFRNKICRALQIRNRVPVTIEMREKHGVVAVIRRGARA